jgi:serine/threonine-protein kinase SRK2
LNSGAHGFVQLVRDKRTGEHVAVKFIERGEKVAGVHESGAAAFAAAQHVPVPRVTLSKPCVLRCDLTRAQITDYVLNEILNHRSLIHPHVVQFKEVRRLCCGGLTEQTSPLWS